MEELKQKQEQVIHIALLQGKAYRTLLENLEASLSSFSLTVLEWKILGLLCCNKETTFRVLYDMLYVEMPLISRIVKKLIEKSLVTKQRLSEDTRKKLLIPTKKGQELFDATFEHVYKNTRELFIGATPEEYLIYNKMLGIINSNRKRI